MYYLIEPLLLEWLVAERAVILEVTENTEAKQPRGDQILMLMHVGRQLSYKHQLVIHCESVC